MSVENLTDILDKNWLSMRPQSRTEGVEQDQPSLTMTADIWKSASDGDVRKVKACVELDGVDVNVANMQGSTALHIAAGLGNLKLVSYLIFAGADRFSRDIDGLTPIHYAARTGHLHIIKLLLEVEGSFSEDFDMKTYDGWTILHFSCRDGHLELFDYIMEVIRTTADMDFGVLVDIEAKTADGRTPLLVASHHGQMRIVESLIESRASIGATCWPDCYGAMHLAALGGHVEVLEGLAHAGQEIDVKSDGRYTPLMLAAAEGHAEACRMLVEASADVSLLSEDQMSALDLACRQGHAPVIVILEAALAVRGLDSFLHVFGHAGAVDKIHVKLVRRQGVKAELDWSEVEAKCPGVASSEDDLAAAVPGCGAFTRLVYVAAHASDGTQILVPRDSDLIASLQAEGRSFEEQSAWGADAGEVSKRLGSVMGHAKRWVRAAGSLIKGLTEARRDIDEVLLITGRLATQ